MKWRPSILLGATAALSLQVLDGLPTFLVQNGWDVHVFSSPGPQLDALRRLDGVTAHPIPIERDPSILRDCLSLVRCYRLIRRIRPDVTFIGTPKAGLVGNLAAWAAHVPRRIYILRGLRLETSTGIRKTILRAAETFACWCAHSVLAVSKSLRQQAIQHKLAPESKIDVLGSGSSNGVDINRFHPQDAKRSVDNKTLQRLSLDPGLPVIGFVGRLTHDKGLTDLGAARTLLQNRGLDHQLLIVGAVDGDSRSLDQLRNSGRAPVEVGYVADTAPYYSTMDVLVLPTHREGFPNVVLEASASEVPVVTTDATGASDSVLHQKTGLIAPKESPTALADAIATLLIDRTTREQFGRNGRQFVVENYEQNAVWTRLHRYFVDGGA